MGWQLGDGIGYCMAGSDLVFLDLARDKYLALRGQDRAAFERLRAGEPNGSEVMMRLAATGLIARSDGQTKLEPAQADVPLGDLSSHKEGAFSLSMTVRAAWGLRWARAAMKPSRIGATIGSAGRMKRRLGIPGDEREIVEIAQRYAACRWIVPVPARCLVDALALDNILLTRGLCATLVFGVRLNPFAAHCWLQTPETVITGTSAEARNYTPILVVR